MHVSLLTIVFAFAYRPWYVLFHIQSPFTEVSLQNGSHTTAVTGENLLYLGNSAYLGMIAALSSSSMIVHLLAPRCCIGLDPDLAMILSHQKWDAYTPK